MLTGLVILYVNVYYTDPNIMQKETPWNWILKVLKCENEIYQRIERKENMRKIGSFV